MSYTKPGEQRNTGRTHIKKGQRLSPSTEFGAKPPWNKGKKLSKEHIEKLKKIPRDYVKGDRNPNWKGGTTSIAEKIRKSPEYKLWRSSVFERDNYTCVWCGGESHGNIEADHIKPFAYFPELRFAIDNGRTLCKPCHMTTDTYLVKARQKYGNKI